MKCMKKDGVVEKVKNEQAAQMVTEGWSYCPKSEYRKFVAGAHKIMDVLGDWAKESNDRLLDKMESTLPVELKKATRKSKKAAE